MSNANDFEIKNYFDGLSLEKYTGTEAHVVIPDTITRIGVGAFRGNQFLVSVHIPDSVQEISYIAFENCCNLKEIRIPKMERINRVAENTFDGCVALADENGFFVNNNILYRYFGNAETVVVPEGVEAIGPGAFSTCYSIKEIILPQTVSNIGYHAFCEMDSVTIHFPKAVHPKVISDTIFKERGYDEYAAHFSGDRKAVKYVLDFECEDGQHAMCLIIRFDNDYTSFNSTFSTYTGAKGINFQEYDNAVILGKRYKTPDKLHAALLRMYNPKEISEQTREWYIEFLKKNVKKAVAFACETDNEIFIKTLIGIEAINAKNRKAITKIVAESNAPKCFAMIEQ